MNYRLIFYALVAPIHLLPFSEDLIRKEFQNYLQKPGIKTLLSLPAHAKRPLVLKERIKHYQEITLDILGLDEPLRTMFLKRLQALMNLEVNQRNWFNQQDEILGLRKDLLNRYGLDDKNGRKAVKIISRIEREFARNNTQYIFESPLAFTGGALPLSKKDFPSLYDMIEKICRAYKLETPTLYTNDTKLLQIQSLPIEKLPRNLLRFHNSAIFLDTEYFNILSDKEIQAVLAHEIAHLYYQDAKKYLAINEPELQLSYAHFREFRADLFAAQLGHSKSLISALEKIKRKANEMKICSVEKYENNETHASLSKRIEALSQLPTSPTTILYDPMFHNKNLTFVERMQSPSLEWLKIVGSSAQPLRALRLLAAAAQRLPK